MVQGRRRGRRRSPARAKALEAAYWSEHILPRPDGADECRRQVAEDGQSADIWTGTQVRRARRPSIVAGILKTTPDKIKIHQQLLGGGYGRRIWPDAAIQATILSNITKKPVKLISRARTTSPPARPRPMTHHVLKAGLDAKGNLVGWHHRSCRRTSMRSRLRRASRRPAARTIIGGAGSIRRTTRSRTSAPKYVREIRGMRVHAWRGIGAGYNKFAAEAFLDESCAGATAVDPLALAARS